MHDEDFDHEHELAMTDAERRAIAEAIIEQDTLELVTVGIDIGSSTSHLLFAKVVLRRKTHDLSSRFVVVDRQILWQSPIILTPFRPDGLIDAHELAHFIAHAYQDAGLTRAEVDTGAVILTGEAIKRRNARAIDEIFASESGKFVCATAGHELESILAAHGSGATALSAARGAPSLHVDIGGGTTKLALIESGEIRSVAAFAVGGRLVARDADGRWTRIDDSALLVAKGLGLDLTPDTAADPAVRGRIAAELARQVVDQITGEPLDELGRALQLTAPLERTVAPAYLTLSGGVSEYVFGHERGDHGDIAQDLARAIIAELAARVRITAVDAGQRIRATVVGASQYTVQVSGKTIHLSDADGLLPVQNAPVAHLGTLGAGTTAKDVRGALDRNATLRGLDHDQPGGGLVALAFTWSGDPSYDNLRAVADGIVSAAGEGTAPLLLMIDGDVGLSLGRIIGTDLGLRRPLLSVDGIELSDLDYVDVGELLDPPGVVPVVIKSLLFS